MLNQFSRTELLIGAEGLQKLSKARVAVFGIGGVGAYAVEALVRSGLGTIDIIDDDKVCITNINRQLYATRKTVGKYKVEVAKERILDINPEIIVNTYQTFYTPQTESEFDFSQYDYVIDAIDTVKAKVQIVQDVSYTVFNNPDNAALSFVESAAAGFVMFTGIKVTLGMGAFR